MRKRLYKAKLMANCLVFIGLLVATYSNQSQAVAEEVSQEKPIRIGLIHFSPPLSDDMDFMPTFRHLEKVFAPRKIQLKIYSSSVLEKKIRNGDIDFFYASSGFFWRMLSYGVKDIATVITSEKPEPNRGTAGTFITLKDRKDIRILEDMKDKKFVANYQTAFHGYRIGMAELVSKGYDYEKFFSQTQFVGEDANKIIHSLISGEADVGFLRACWLEEFELNNIPVMDKLKVIGAVPGSIRCLHSTREYPNNTFGSTFRVDQQLAKQMAVALLTMNPTLTGQAWSIATDFKPVDRLYKELKVGPYEHLRRWTLKRVWNEFWPFILMALMSLIGLILHTLRSDQLVARRTAELTEAVSRKEILEKRFRNLEERMETKQKLNLVGQLSSIFAHEMNQPLGVCSCYIEGLRELSKTGSVDSVTLNYSLQQLQVELDRATGIVNKVRAYAKSGGVNRSTKVNISEVSVDVLKTIESKNSGKLVFEDAIEADVFIQADPLEAQLIVWNLVKNAVEAALESDKPAVSLEVTKFGDVAKIGISNTGKVLSEEDFLSIGNKILSSHKLNGLGIGLAMVFSIVEASAGRVEKRRNPDGGLTLVVMLPLWKSSKNE